MNRSRTLLYLGGGLLVLLGLLSCSLINLPSLSAGEPHACRDHQPYRESDPTPTPAPPTPAEMSTEAPVETPAEPPAEEPTQAPAEPAGRRLYIL